jgi:hypothetical protein
MQIAQTPFHLVKTQKEVAFPQSSFRQAPPAAAQLREHP